jgi:tRNA threonylcarbamoyl adenosine modification protein (Sua5/YciO/YrdC/YwlC family)
MRVYDCDEGREQDLTEEEFLLATAKLLASGRVLAMPTDTVFGMISAAQSLEGVERVAALKGRDRGVPPPVIVGSAASAYSLSTPATWPLLDLIAPLWPAPISAVIESETPLARVVNPNGQSVAVRVPDHELLRRVAEQTPVIASSANRHGCSPVKCGAEMFEHFEGEGWPKRDVLQSFGVALVVAEGTSGESPSTVVGWNDGRIVCLREGAGDHLLRAIDPSFGMDAGA